MVARVTHPADADILHRWKFDETSGDAADDIGGLTATQVGTIAAQTGIIDGARGVFALANHFAWDISSFTPQTFTAATWYYYAGAQPNYAHLFSVDRNSVVADSWAIWFDHTNGGIVSSFIYMTDASAAGGGDAGGTGNSVGWHHVAITWDGTTLKMYVDGVLQSSDASQAGKTIDYTGYGGGFGYRKHNPEQYFNGYIDDAVVYSTAKDAQWIWKVYSAIQVTSSTASVTNGTREPLSIVFDNVAAAIVIDSLTINGVTAVTSDTISSDFIGSISKSGNKTTVTLYPTGEWNFTPGSFVSWAASANSGVAVSFSGTFEALPAQSTIVEELKVSRITIINTAQSLLSDGSSNPNGVINWASFGGASAQWSRSVPFRVFGRDADTQIIPVTFEWLYYSATASVQLSWFRETCSDVVGFNGDPFKPPGGTAVNTSVIAGRIGVYEGYMWSREVTEDVGASGSITHNTIQREITPHDPGDSSGGGSESIGVPRILTLLLPTGFWHRIVFTSNTANAGQATDYLVVTAAVPENYGEIQYLSANTIKPYGHEGRG